MDEPLEISDKIWMTGEKIGFERFSSEEAWDWYTRGCPEGEAIDHGPGLLLQVLSQGKASKEEALKWRIDL